MPDAGPELTLYYDGGCNLCDVSQTRAGKWALRAKVPMRAVMLQEEEAIEKGYSEAMVLETPDGVFQAADAWLELMRRVAPWYLKPVSWMVLTKPTRALARWAYGIVAKYRIKWFGSKACAIPVRH